MQMHVATYTFGAHPTPYGHVVAIIREMSAGAGGGNPEIIATAGISPQSNQITFTSTLIVEADVDPDDLVPVDGLLQEKDARAFRGIEGGPLSYIMNVAYSWLSLNEIQSYEKPSLQSEDDKLVLYADSLSQTAFQRPMGDRTSSQRSRPKRRKQNIKVWI